MKENKAKVVRYLEATINATREGLCDSEDYSRQIGLQLSEDENLVHIYRGDEKIADVNVACDSGIAIMRDVLRHSVFQ